LQISAAALETGKKSGCQNVRLDNDLQPVGARQGIWNVVLTAALLRKAIKLTV